MLLGIIYALMAMKSIQNHTQLTCFFVSGNKLSIYWQLSFCTNFNGAQVASLVFEEWAGDRRFYER